jgi:DNA-binding transcriptional regulator YbjK
MKEMSISSAEVLSIIPAEMPKKRGSRETRVPEILDAAIAVLAAEGNSGFTQRRIANDAGIRLRTLQHYFPTREELLHATVAEMTHRYVESYRVIVRDKSRSPEAKLDAIVDETFSLLTRPGASAFAIEVWSLAEHDEILRRLVATSAREFEDMFAEIVASMNAALTTGECTLRGALLVSNLHGLAVYIRRANESAANIDAFKGATKLVWRALGKAS